MSALYAAARIGDAKAVREFYRNPRVHAPALEVSNQSRGGVRELRHCTLRPWHLQLPEDDSCDSEKDAATAMLAACRYGHVEVVRVFLQEGIDFHTVDKEKRGLLCSAALAPNFCDVAQLLLDQGALDINGSFRKPSSGDCPLAIACAQRRQLLVEQLLRLPGLNVNATCDSRNYTALMISCEMRDAALVSALLAHPAINVNLRSEVGETALIIAARWCAPDVVSILLSADGIDVNARDRSNSYSALIWACHQNHLEVAERLLADPRTDCFLEYVVGLDGVHLATLRGLTAMAELLLAHQQKKKKSRTRNSDPPPSKYSTNRYGYF